MSRPIANSITHSVLLPALILVLGPFVISTIIISSITINIANITIITTTTMAATNTTTTTTRNTTKPPSSAFRPLPPFRSPYIFPRSRHLFSHSRHLSSRSRNLAAGTRHGFSFSLALFFRFRRFFVCFYSGLFRTVASGLRFDTFNTSLGAVKRPESRPPRFHCICWSFLY